MFCSNCGKQIPDGSAFCPSCGKGLNNAQQPPLPQQTPQQPATPVQTNAAPAQVAQTPAQPIPQQFYPGNAASVYQAAPAPAAPIEPKKKKPVWLTAVIVIAAIMLLLTVLINIAASFDDSSSSSSSESPQVGSSQELVEALSGQWKIAGMSANGQDYDEAELAAMGFEYSMILSDDGTCTDLAVSNNDTERDSGVWELSSRSNSIVITIAWENAGTTESYEYDSESGLLIGSSSAGGVTQINYLVKL